MTLVGGLNRIRPAWSLVETTVVLTVESTVVSAAVSAAVSTVVSSVVSTVELTVKLTVVSTVLSTIVARCSVITKRGFITEWLPWYFFPAFLAQQTNQTTHAYPVRKKLHRRSNERTSTCKKTKKNHEYRCKYLATCSSVRLFVCTAHLFACSILCSLAHFAHSLAYGTVNWLDGFVFCVFFLFRTIVCSSWESSWKDFTTFSL